MKYSITVLLPALFILFGFSAGLADPTTEEIEGPSVFADGFETLMLLDCDPLDLMSCNPNPDVSACFINPSVDNAFCASPGPSGQNDLCMFLNSCTAGLSCILVISGNPACTHHCDPATGTTAYGNSCADLPELVDGTCVALNQYFSGTTISHVGLCLDCDRAENDQFCN